MNWALDDLGGGRWRLRLVHPGPSGEVHEFTEAGVRTGAQTMMQLEFSTGPARSLADECRAAWVTLKNRTHHP